MTLGGFLDASYALLAEEFQRLNIAFDQAKERILGPESVPEPVKRQQRAADNKASLDQIRMMLAGTGKKLELG